MHLSNVEAVPLVQSASGATVRGLRATRSINEGEDIFAIPFARMVRSSALIRDGDSLYTRTLGNYSDELLALTMAMLEGNAEWLPYINAMQTSFEKHPVWWYAFPDEYPRAMEQMRGSKSLRKVDALLKEKTSTLHRSYRMVAKMYEEHPLPRVKQSLCDPKLFTRAVLHVATHTYDYNLDDVVDATAMKQFVALVPVIDLINAPDRKRDANVQYFPQMHAISGEAKLFCRATAGIEAGQELYHAYHDGQGGPVRAEHYFVNSGWLPKHMERKDPRKSKAIRKALAMADEDLATRRVAPAQRSGAWPIQWPIPPGFCDRLMQEHASPAAPSKAKRSKSKSKSKNQVKQELR